MLDIEFCRKSAVALDVAFAGQTTVPLISAAHPTMNIVDGYAVQRCWADLRICPRRKPGGLQSRFYLEIHAKGIQRRNTTVWSAVR